MVVWRTKGLNLFLHALSLQKGPYICTHYCPLLLWGVIYFHTDRGRSRIFGVLVTVSPLKLILSIDLPTKMMFNSVITILTSSTDFDSTIRGHLITLNLPSFKSSLLFQTESLYLILLKYTRTPQHHRHHSTQQCSVKWMLRWRKVVTDVTIIHDWKEKRSMKSQWHFLYCGEVISSKLNFILWLHFLFERQQFIAIIILFPF